MHAVDDAAASAGWVTKGPFLVKELQHESGSTGPAVKLDVHIKPGEANWPAGNEAYDEDGLPVLFWLEKTYLGPLNTSVPVPRGCFIWRSKLAPDMPAQFVHVAAAIPTSAASKYKLFYWHKERRDPVLFMLAVLGGLLILYGLASGGTTMKDAAGSASLLALTLAAAWGSAKFLEHRAHRARDAGRAVAEKAVWSGETPVGVQHWPWHFLESFQLNEKSGSGVFASFGLKFDEFRIMDADKTISRLLTSRFIAERTAHFQRLGLDRLGCSADA